MVLESFDAQASTAAVVDVLRRDGGVIVRSLAPAGLIDACSVELRPALEEYDQSQRTNFSGSRTLRCGAVLRYAASAAALVAHPYGACRVADAIPPLPSCAEYQIGSTTGIEILPGESDQQLHRDDTPYPIQVAGLELQIGVMWSFNDFTVENGATRGCPGQSSVSARVAPPGPDPLGNSRDAERFCAFLSGVDVAWRRRQSQCVAARGTD